MDDIDPGHPRLILMLGASSADLAHRFVVWARPVVLDPGQQAVQADSMAVWHPPDPGVRSVAEERSPALCRSNP
jgi:hypothetical protein